VTTELIAQYYAAFNAGDWERMIGFLAADVAHDLNQGPREVGVDAFRAFLARMNRCYRERLEDIVIMAGPDGRFAAEWVVHGEYLASDDGLPPAHGQRYVLPGGAFFAVADGKITRITNFYNLEDWLRQVK
jgi:steroid delta-isomerase-like uncharacterized protein